MVRVLANFMNDSCNPYEWHTEEADNGTRLDAFLARELGVSRSRARVFCDGATIDGTPCKPSQSLKSGQRVLAAIPTKEEPLRAATAISIPQNPAFGDLPILYEDDDFLIINKPRGLVVHEGAGETGATLVDVLRARDVSLSSVGPSERAGIVHRLDKETTGVMAVCKTDAAHWKLAEDFAERRIRKEYLALCCGVPPARGRIEAPIFRHPTHRKKMAVVATGRHAVTEYEIEKSWPRFALLRVNLLTGRTHQIRVHLAHLNYPVAGDVLYGGARRATQIAAGDTSRAALEQLGGQALHAATLGFAHPITGADMKFEAPLPEDFTRVLAALDDEK